MALALLMLCAATGCRSSEGGVRHENYDLGYVNPPGAASMEPLDGIRCDDAVPPIVTRRVEPRYPADVRRQRVRGVVSVSLIIGTDGTPSDIQVRSSPSATLSELALEAVSRRITVANGMLTGEFPGGRRETWPLADLYAEGRQVLVVVRERNSGRIAFVVRPGTPDQKALADFLGGKDGPEKRTPA